MLPEIATTEEALKRALEFNLAAVRDQHDPTSLSVTLSKLAEDCMEDDGVLRGAYQLLGAIASLHLKPDDPNRPFEPWFVSDTGRSPDVDDFTDEQVNLIQKVTGAASDHVLRARLGDFVWNRKKDHELARLAVDSYVRSAMAALPTVYSSMAMDWLRRALQVAAFLGKEREPFSSTRLQVVALALDEEQANVIACSSLEILGDFGADDPKHLAELSEKRAKRKDTSPIWQRNFWEHARKWHLRAGDDSRATSALAEIAKTFEREADEAPSNSAPSHIRTAHFLECALQAYRRVPDCEKEREHIHRRLLEAQEKAAGELQSFSTEVDLSDAVGQSREAVRDKPLDEALDCLSMSCQSRDKGTLRTEATEMVDKFVLQSIFPATTMGPMGKVAAKQSVMSRKSGDDRESQILLKMFWIASLHRRLLVVGVIEPMRKQILSEHHVSDRDIGRFVTFNPLVPPGREPFYVHGLIAGFYGNFMEALHLLIPQLEHSIRYALSMKGVITSSLDDDGIQKEHDLNRLLYGQEITELFSEDIVFDLRSLLVEPASINFRNQMAHGMLEPGAFFSESAVYIWWLMFHMCALGGLAARDRQEKNIEDKTTESGC